MLLFFFTCNRQILSFSDTNSDLIVTYQAIKENWEKVLRLLKIHHLNHNTSYYYKIRSSRPINRFAIASRFIYLNRTCWNGLYRVNLQGKFNVPKDSKDSVLLDSDNFASVAASLSGAQLQVTDFETTINLAKKGDLVFVDPPYTVKHKSNGFIKYNESLFHWDDQIRLSNSLVKAKQRGAIIIATNASHSSIRKLYKNDFEITTVNRSSIIAAKSQYRKQAEEFIIRSI